MDSNQVRDALQLAERPARPPADFADALFARLITEVKSPHVPARGAVTRRSSGPRLDLPRLNLRWPLQLRWVTVGAVGLAVVMAVGALLAGRPQSALAVIREAEVRFAEVPPFRATIAGSSRAIAQELDPGAEVSYPHEQVISYGGTAGWRRDVVVDPATFRGGPGSFTVWDGEQLGEYLAETNEFILTPDASEEDTPRSELNAVQQIERLLDQWFADDVGHDGESFVASACTVRTDDEVAGRQARQLSCAETTNDAGAVVTYPMQIWVDAEYGLVLRFLYGGPLPGETQVTEIDFEPDFAAGTFTVLPPPGATVLVLEKGPPPAE